MRDVIQERGPASADSFRYRFVDNARHKLFQPEEYARAILPVLQPPAEAGRPFPYSNGSGAKLDAILVPAI